MKRQFALMACVLALALPLLSAACGGGPEPTFGPQPTPTEVCVEGLCILESYLTESMPASGDWYRPRLVEGIIINKGDTAFAEVEVVFSLYDKEGKQLGTCSKAVTDLEPGQRWKFGARIPGSIEADVTSFKLESLTGR